MLPTFLFLSLESKLSTDIMHLAPFPHSNFLPGSVPFRGCEFCSSPELFVIDGQLSINGTQNRTCLQVKAQCLILEKE